jgi:hypothetical protein
MRCSIYCDTISVTVAATIHLQYLCIVSMVVATVKPKLSGFKFQFCLFGVSSLSHFYPLIRAPGARRPRTQAHLSAVSLGRHSDRACQHHPRRTATVATETLPSTCATSSYRPYPLPATPRAKIFFPPSCSHLTVSTITTAAPRSHDKALAITPC